MTDYTLICGTPGVHLQESCRRIRTTLERAVGSVSYIHSDSKASMNVADYVQLPRAEACRVWNEAVSGAICSLDPTADVSLVSAHLTLYERSKSVFFSPSQLDTFTAGDSTPTRIVLLIDDIFDMHKRLAEHNKIFSEEQIAKDVRQDTAEAAWPGNVADRDFNQVEEQLFRVEARIGILNLLLSWRRLEMIIAENIANQLGIPLYLIGVKHPISMFELIADQNSTPHACYISHPITSVRRGVVDDSSVWPDYAHQLNKLPATLLARNIIGIMPTAIDELRFGLHDVETNVSVYTTGLRPRWPLTNDDRVIDELPATDDQSGFDTKTVKVNSPYVSGLMRGLWLTIANEVPFRDHYLVTNTKHFLAYQPRENGGGFSRGVTAEINHFSHLTKFDKTRRMAVVHDIRDVRQIQDAIRKEGDSLPLGLEPVIARIQHEATRVGVQDLSDLDAQALVQRRAMPTGLLSRRGGAEQSLLSIRDSALVDFALRNLHRHLTTFGDARPWCKVIIADLSRDDWAVDVANWFDEAEVPVGASPFVGIDKVMSNDELLIWIEEVYKWTRPLP